MPFNEDGFESLKDCIPEQSIVAIKKDISEKFIAPCRGGIRNAEKHFPTLNALINSSHIIQLANQYLTGQPSVVRTILFDKTPENNWLVSWHQDKTVAVSAPFEQDGWGPWSIKDGVHHVQAPVAALDRMVTLRIHLDPADESTGCLKVIPGSHRLGVLTQHEIDIQRQQCQPVTCHASAGSILVMRPHLLHASSKASHPSSRKVIHVEYSDYSLPKGVSWA
ncbi:phytanoyl-CoA dioxygenase family protein [Hahella ganghwensis]|uniref:phytanoyl-CoA dioxygenase family protein n=1 Tax=Hahella ganghwensis TaxID=286420 RepID=UPI00037155EA|nr:phytanoyl-CoA dioxygenase family protein [Hahella ganghwensis]